eukprot:12918828-Prorocentrum_lima.AAC.1
MPLSTTEVMTPSDFFTFSGMVSWKTGPWPAVRAPFILLGVGIASLCNGNVAVARKPAAAALAPRKLRLGV